MTFGAQWEEFTSLHHAADWLAAHGVRVSASTLYCMYYRHRWEGTERATARNITPLPVHVHIYVNVTICILLCKNCTILYKVAQHT